MLDVERRPTPSPDTEPPERSRSRRPLIAAGVVLGVAVVAAGAFGLSRGGDAEQTEPATPAIDARVGGGITGRIGSGSIADTIEQLEARVAELPDDDVSWATLGIAYVDQARVTGDSSLYDRADEALDRSLEANDRDNFLAETGRAAVAAARHDFALAETHALAGLEINPSNALLWGVLGDAQIQLGKYNDGFAAVERMGELVPDVAAISRAAYVAELQGNDGEARRLMERALRDAFGPDDRAFALFQLGEMELGANRPNDALGYFLEALEASPNDISALSGKAHALGLAGQTQTAARNYELLLERAPIADFMIEYGEFLEGEGRIDEADQWYERAREQIAVDTANGVRPDAGSIFFETDHGDAEAALEEVETAVVERPFFELHEAHGWALYRNGRYDEASAAMDEAASIGINDPELFVRWALIEHARGDREAAVEHLTTAASMNPEALPYLTDDELETVAELGARIP